MIAPPCPVRRPRLLCSGPRRAAWLLFALWIPASALLGQDGESRLRRTLKAHGIAFDSPALVRFLRDGPPDLARLAAVERAPDDKSRLLAIAWDLLARRHDQPEFAGPLRSELSALSLRYAQDDLPDTVRDLIDQDFLALPTRERIAQTRRRTDVLELKGMLALGIFGDDDPALLAAARRIRDRQPPSSVRRLNYAIALALLGDHDVVQELVDEAVKANATTSTIASRALSALYDCPTEIRSVQAESVRAEGALAILQWWEESRDGLPALRRHRAVARLLPRAEPTPYPQGSLREVLRAAADRADVSDALGSRTAWSRLDAMGPELTENLEPILRDEREDLDIRTEAMRWYARLRGKKAKRLLKRLRKDPNPPIARLATGLLEQLAKR